MVLFGHGFHPFAEDGGLYVAGVQYTMHPATFPHATAFVTEHLSFSCFAPVVVAATRWLPGSLHTTLLALYLLSAGLMLWAGWRVCRACLPTHGDAAAGVALLAAWWTMPVAGTSLLLMDPYVTARSFSTPFSLLAVAAILRSPARHFVLEAVLWLALAAAFHPLMAGYGMGLVLALSLSLRRAPAWQWVTAGGAVLLLALALQVHALPEPATVRAAVQSRPYWFLSAWQPYEWCGLLGPAVVLFALLRSSRLLTAPGRALCRAALALSALSVAVALLFARQTMAVHAVARLQPLRAFLPVYAVMALLVGGALCGLAQRWAVARPRSAAWVRALPAGMITASLLIFFAVQRASFPRSAHVEWPARPSDNPWAQAFQWIRDHTPEDAFFALDARYITTPGEDAQSFRALAERSAVPDFSKDGGEAAITPSLAGPWQQAVRATEDLSALDDAERDTRLRSLGVSWVVLHAAAHTAHPCPFQNAVVKVCFVGSERGRSYPALTARTVEGSAHSQAPSTP